MKNAMTRIARSPLVAFRFEVALAGWGVSVGVGALLGTQPPNSLRALIPWEIALLWQITLPVSALLVIAGLATQRYDSVLVWGLRLMATGILAYGVAVLGVGASGLVAGTLMVYLATVVALTSSMLRDAAAQGNLRAGRR